MLIQRDEHPGLCSQHRFRVIMGQFSPQPDEPSITSQADESAARTGMTVKRQLSGEQRTLNEAGQLFR